MTITVTFKPNATLKQLSSVITALTKQSGNDTLIIIIQDSIITVPSRKLKYDARLISEVAERISDYGIIEILT